MRWIKMPAAMLTNKIPKCGLLIIPLAKSDIPGHYGAIIKTVG